MTDMQTMLVAQEGERLRPYVDTLGNLSIGVGCNLANRRAHAEMLLGHPITDEGITHDEAMSLLNDQIADALEDVRHCTSCYDTLSRPRQQVLVSMAFNLGRDRLSHFVRFLGALHLGEWEEAAAQIENSRAAIEDPYRYGQLANMMRNDVSPWL